MRASGPATAGAEPSPQGEGNPLAGLQRPRRGSSWVEGEPDRLEARSRVERHPQTWVLYRALVPRAQGVRSATPWLSTFSFSKFSPRPPSGERALAKTQPKEK